jgi:threonine/homoserine/homoserine lactone efflux protein
MGATHQVWRVAGDRRRFKGRGHNPWDAPSLLDLLENDVRKAEDLFESLLIGGGFAFAAAMQPGPLQAFFLSSVARRGWRRTLPACLAPLVSDGPIALLVLLVLSRVPPSMTTVLQAAGGVLLLYYGWGSYRDWRKGPVTSDAAEAPGPSTLMQAVAVNILNPNPYLGWSLVLGPSAVKAWQVQPIHAIALVTAFYATMVVAMAGTIALMGTTRFLGPRVNRVLILVSAILLASIGLFLLTSSLIAAVGGQAVLPPG